MVNYTCRGARPSVTTLPNEAVSLKGKQLRTLSCVPAWLKLVKTVDFGSVHALFVFYSVIHFQQAIFCCCTAIWNLVSRPLRPFRPLQPCVLGYSLDKVYQVGIAKSFKLKPCRTNYPHDSTRPIWNQLQFLKPVQCVNVAPAYIVRGGSIPLCCRGSVQTRQVRDPVQARNAKAAERHANKSSCRLRPQAP